MSNKVIGLVKEVKNNEGRVALTPDSVAHLISKGFAVNVTSKAGFLSGFSDEDYSNVGALILPSNKEVYAKSPFIVKVKEPIMDDLIYLNESHTLFCYLHLASSKSLTTQLMNKKITAYAFETLEDNNELPLLKPMSQIAGRVSIQMAMFSMMSSNGGSGLLIGGLDGKTKNVRVAVVGAGKSGQEAAKMAASLGAHVDVFDINENSLFYLSTCHSNISTHLSTKENLLQTLPDADIVIGSVLLKGDAAPKIIDKEILSNLKKGCVVVDIAIDQGGCVEGIKPTSYAQPSYNENGITFVAVTNLPGGVCKTSTKALSDAITPYIEDVFYKKETINSALNIENGSLKIDVVKKLFNL